MKTWEKPVLIVLTRNAAESVLSVCKVSTVTGVEAAAVNGSPSDYFYDCYVYDTACAGCQQLDRS